ncbi:MAG: helix-turn-helix transcriptional regulator [Clostridia bacterium]|nr:helix-turn-helix transcriptional regulator [Clostridia bacterium]
MEFSKKMILLRKQNGYTQETFAEEIGVSRQSVYKWEAGQAYPEVEKLIKIGRVLGIKIDDLLNDEYVVEAAPAAPRAKRVKKAEEVVEVPVAEEPVAVAEVAPAPVAEEAPVQQVEQAPAVKKGFFSRIFGGR